MQSDFEKQRSNGGKLETLKVSIAEHWSLQGLREFYATKSDNKEGEKSTLETGTGDRKEISKSG
jgi:hypothetical protein